MPTYDVYYYKIKKAFTQHCRYLSKSNIDAYFDTDEVTSHIKECYNRDINKYRRGEITEEVLLNGCVWSVVCCLNLMY